MMKTLVAWAAPLLLVLGACGGDDDMVRSDTAGRFPQLTFDGLGCGYEGPGEVTAGPVVVEFVNVSDGHASVSVLLLDEGKTVQDYIDFISPEPFTREFIAPWVSDMGGQPPANAGETISWEADLAAGEYVAVCGDRWATWFGFGLIVVDG